MGVRFHFARRDRFHCPGLGKDSASLHAPPCRGGGHPRKAGIHNAIGVIFIEELVRLDGFPVSSPPKLENDAKPRRSHLLRLQIGDLEDQLSREADEKTASVVSMVHDSS